MQVEITFVTDSFIIFANSLADTNSVTFKTFLSSSARASFSSISARILSRFSLLNFDDLDLPPPLKRASVSLICF